MNLITGATGHVGNVLARELLAQGQRVRALVLPGEDRAALTGLPVEVVEGDVLDRASLDAALAGVEILYHLAAVITILPGRNDWVRRVNIEGTQNVLQAAREAGVRRMVYTSSIHAFQRVPSGVTLDERVPFDPSSPTNDYDRSKAEASLFVQQAVRQGLDAVIACPTGVVGPYDFRRSEMGRLMHDWMERRTHLLVEGGFDFVDVRDVAHGLALAGERGRCGETYLLPGERIRLIDLHTLVQGALGFHTKAIALPLALARGVARLAPSLSRLARVQPRFTLYSLEAVTSCPIVSPAKACRELGYQARPLRQTAADTVRWWQGQLP